MIIIMMMMMMMMLIIIGYKSIDHITSESRSQKLNKIDREKVMMCKGSVVTNHAVCEAYILEKDD